MPVVCRRHGFPFVPSLRPGAPFYVVRCCHCGPRFVVQLRNHQSGFNIVDYVEDLPDGELIVEPTSGLDDEASTEAFDRAVSRMLAGEPPQPEE